MSVIYTSPKYVRVSFCIYSAYVCVYTHISLYSMYLYICMDNSTFFSELFYKHRPIPLAVEIPMQLKLLFAQSNEVGGL